MAGKKSFVKSMERLIRETPKRSLKGSVVVDQVYAHYQHEGLDFQHPDGGEAEYLRKPLYLKRSMYMRRLAREAITSQGTRRLKDAMVDNMEDLSNEVYKRAPLEFGDLKGSGQPIVRRDGRKVFHRAPNVHRLSEQELRIKGQLRYLYDPHRYRRDR